MSGCAATGLLELQAYDLKVNQCTIAAIMDASKRRARITYQLNRRVSSGRKPGQSFPLGQPPGTVFVEIAAVDCQECTAMGFEFGCHIVGPLIQNIIVPHHVTGPDRPAHLDHGPRRRLPDELPKVVLQVPQSVGGDRASCGANGL